MGEKIKNIKLIKIGRSEMMVELNAGTSPGQGNIIHIQNEKMRYSLTEKEFLEFAGMVIRAKAEIDYIKKGTDDGDN
jgi:hypothetical protein